MVETGLDLYAPLAVFLLTGTLFVVFFLKRRATSVHALDWMMGVFGATSLLGLMDALKVLFNNKTSFFVADNVPRALDVVTVIHLMTLILLYFFAENFLGDRLNSYRLAFISFMTALFFAPAILYSATDYYILTSDVFPIAQDTGFDAFVFDIIQVFSVSLIFYVFIAQTIITDNKEIRRFLVILDIAIFLFLGTAFLEALEHIVPVGDFNAFLTALPTFFILAIFYIRNPNFVYLAPANIAFLQIVSKNGELLYAAELTEELNTADFLVGPSLTSVNSLIAELVNQERSKVELEQFKYTGGYILFESVGDIRAILQTDRPSQILKRSMRYFLREFHKNFSGQLDHYKGYIETTSDGISPDDVFLQCIPIVQSKTITSTFSRPVPA